MPTTFYHTVDGEIQGQTTAGVRTDYLSDALGSVVATVNSSAQVVNTYRHRPYGELLAKTGVGADPRFGWTGVTGSRATLRQFAQQFTRARHFGSSQGQWISVDPTWPNQWPFVYCLARPTTLIDPSGLDASIVGFGCSTKDKLHDECPIFDFFWETRWVLYPGMRWTPKGFIVQKITASLAACDCCDISLLDLNPPPYWEAWEVDYPVVYNGYKSTNDPRGIDKWLPWDVARGLSAECGQITVKILGEACYFQSQLIDWKPGGVPSAGSLPSTYDEPDFWRKGPNCITRTLLYKLVCCEDCEPTNHGTEPAVFTVTGCVAEDWW